MEYAMILLAAGRSLRFGSDKLLYPVEGIPMYRRALGCLEAVKRSGGTGPLLGLSLSITVVTRQGEIAEAAAKAGAGVLINPHPEEGISSSLKLGLGANLHRDACLFAVADQPWLTPETVGRLLALFTGSEKGIACVSHGERTGNPCIFSRKYYPELLRLTGDTGGKRVLSSHREDLAVLQTEERELTDMDTILELQR